MLRCLQITSKQLRDDLMTLLIAGHETTAAVLTWTLYCLVDRPDVLRRLQEEVLDVASAHPHGQSHAVAHYSSGRLL